MRSALESFRGKSLAASDNNNDDEEDDERGGGGGGVSWTGAAAAGAALASTAAGEAPPPPKTRTVSAVPRRRRATYGEETPRPASGVVRMPMDGEIHVGNYAFSRSREQLLGKGSFADVFRGVDLQTGAVIAVKVVDVLRVSRDNDKVRKHLEDEMAITMELKHRNIVEMLAIHHLDSETLCMMLELCDVGDMAQYLKKYGKLPEADARSFMQNFADGLAYVHARNIIHRDIKPQNLLLKSVAGQRLPELKICDFGMARVLEPSNITATVCGSPLYMAPEVLLGQSYTSKADLWSAGAVMYEMIAGIPPFPAKSSVQLVQMVQQTTRPYITFSSGASSRVSAACVSMVEGLLQIEPSPRLSVARFCQHRWLTGEGSDQAPKLPASSLPPRSREVAIPSSRTTPAPQHSDHPHSAPNVERVAGGASGTLDKIRRLKRERSKTADGFSPQWAPSSSEHPRRQSAPFSSGQDQGSLSPPFAAGSVPNNPESAPRNLTRHLSEALMLSPPASPRGAASGPDALAKLLAASDVQKQGSLWSPEEEFDEKVVRRARAIAALARDHLGPSRTGHEHSQCDAMAIRDALVLFTRSLTVLKRLIRRVRSRAMGDSSLSNTSLSLSLRWTTNLERYRAEFGSILEEAEDLLLQHGGELSQLEEERAAEVRLRGIQRADSSPGDSNADEGADSAAILMYYGAMNLGCDAAAAEFMGKPLGAVEEQFTGGLLLLEQLKEDASSPADKSILRMYADLFRDRASAVAARRGTKDRAL